MTAKSSAASAGATATKATTKTSKKTKKSTNTGRVDDLKVVEGIGPVIEKHLHANGIRTYEQLADADPVHIKSILDSAGDRLAVHDPETRPAQAGYARDGDLTALAKYQETLKAGRA